MTLNINFLLSDVDKSRKVYWYNGENITIDDVQKNVFGFAHSLLDKEIKAGDTVILNADDSVRWIYTFWALTVIGVKIIVLLKNLEPHNLQQVLSNQKVQHIITDDEQITTKINIININYLISTNVEKIEPYRYADNEPFMCWASSGTNGGFKLVVHTNSSFFNNTMGLKHYAKLFDVGAGDILYCPAKLAFGLGCLFSVLGPLAIGYQAIIGVPIIQKIRTFNSFLTDVSVNHLVLTPAVLNAITRANSSMPLSLRSVVTSAEPLSQSVADRFEEKFNVNVHSLYGSAELIIVSVEDTHHKEHCVGKILPHVTVRIVDDIGNECTQGMPGVIQVKTPTQFIGYSNDDKSTADVIREGWVHTNDIGYIDNKNQLAVLGRYNSCVKIKGKWLYLLELEDVIMNIPGIKDCVVVLSDLSDIHAFVVTDSVTTNDIQKILMKKFNNRHAVPKEILLVHDILKTANSKKIRNYSLIKKLIS